MKKKKIIIAVAGLLVAAILAVGGTVFWALRTDEEAQEDIVLEKGQSLLYGQITAIHGNEMTYEVMELQETGQMSVGENRRNRAQENPEGSTQDQQDREESPEGSTENQQGRGERPEGRPQNMQDSGELSEGRPDFSDMEGRGGMGERPMAEQGQYVSTGESLTVQIPVGTQVTTKLGTVTGFSRLAAGDTIKLMVQEEKGEQIILALWIVE